MAPEEHSSSDNREGVWTVEGEDHEDTKHQAHTHARPRIVWGIVAVVLVASAILVGAKWGDEIKEACFGEEGACTLDIDTVPESGTTFEDPEGFGTM